MYSPRKIASRLALASSEFHITPEYHTPAEVDEFNKSLIDTGKYTFNEMGAPDGTQNLTPLDREWMLNEQVLCSCDANYLLTRYAYIKDEQNVIRRFSLRTPQKLFFDIICDLEDLDSAIEIIALKARQLGVSTLVELLIGMRIIFGYGVNAVIGSADQTKTALMSNMLFLFYDNLPIWLRPKWTRRVESDRGMLVFGHSSSGVSFQHGAQASGIARGTTPTIYHLSECASFTDPVNQIEASLFKAVHASPSVFGVLESTGEGNIGWWPDTWRHAKANWPLRRARLCPLFLPWFCGTDIYPTPTWLRMRPVPSAWRPNHDTRSHIAKSELFVRSSPLLAKHLGASWRMPLTQQWYWEVEHEQAKAKNIESVFLQEMAGDDEEALQRSSESVFGHETIQVITDSRKREYRAYGISGQSVEDNHEPPAEDIDYSRDRIPLRLHNPAKSQTHRWELIPLHFHTPLREDNPEDSIGKLIVYHPPSPGIRYSIGIDTSEGKGEDSTVISVWGLGSGQLPDFQAAEFSSCYVSHTEAFAFGAAIGTYYAAHMSMESTKWPMPYVTIEQVAAVGDTCQGQMMRMGYPVRCFHAFTRQDLTPQRMAKLKRGPSVKRGWYTYGWSRPILTGYFVQCAQNGWIRINSPWLVEEMKQFEVHLTSTGKEKMEHEQGAHDDRIFAAAMATFCPHDQDIVAERSKKRIVEADALPPIDLGPYAGHTVSYRALRDSRPLELTDIVYATDSLRKFQF
jgi:hypothetical protein